MEELKKRDLLIVAVLSTLTAGIYNLYLLFDWETCIEALEKKIGKSCGVENIFLLCMGCLAVYIYGIVSIFLPEDFHKSSLGLGITGLCTGITVNCLCSIPKALNTLTGKFEADALSAWILCILSAVSEWVFILYDEGLGWIILMWILDTIYFVVVQNMFNKTRRLPITHSEKQ